MGQTTTEQRPRQDNIESAQKWHGTLEVISLEESRECVDDVEMEKGPGGGHRGDDGQDIIPTSTCDVTAT